MVFLWEIISFSKYHFRVQVLLAIVYGINIEFRKTTANSIVHCHLWQDAMVEASGQKKGT